jgi:hypothetical protein
MGTRCDTIMYNGADKEIAVLYRQYDGYPDGHGKELKKFLNGKKIINGISGEDNHNFNGMDCLAAALVAHFKKTIGGFYLNPAGSRDGEYQYKVMKDHSSDAIKVIIKNHDDEIIEEWKSLNGD